MKKYEAEGFVFVVTIAIVLSPFYWLYSLWGWWGVAGLVILLLMLLVAWLMRSGNATLQSIDAFSDEAKELLINHRANDGSVGRDERVARMRSNPAQAEFLRSIEIIAESCWLVFTGKKKDTIDSRLKVLMAQVGKLNFSLVNDETHRYILAYINLVHDKWQTTRYLNEAMDMVKKADKLKTANGRIKRLLAAQALLINGLAEYPDNAALQMALSMTPTRDIDATDLVMLADRIVEKSMSALEVDEE